LKYERAFQPGAVNLAAVDGGSGGAIRFYSGGSLLRGTWTSAGELIVGAVTTTVGSVKVYVDFSGSVNNGLFLNDSASGSGVIFQYFGIAGVPIGNIARVGATSVVAYNTTSDQRFKNDKGIAKDLTGLRAVVVHDFAWKASGTGDRGIFAQEAYRVFPRAITPGDDHDVQRPWMADYSKFVPDLIVGWQQHDARLAALEARFKES